MKTTKKIPIFLLLISIFMLFAVFSVLKTEPAIVAKAISIEAKTALGETTIKTNLKIVQSLNTVDGGYLMIH